MQNVARRQKTHMSYKMEKVSTPYDFACNAALLTAYSAAFGYSIRVLYQHVNGDRFIQLMQYLISVFYACI